MVAAVETRTSVSLPSTLSGELTVLRAPPLDDVHARHDLDAAHEAHPHRGGQHQDFLQRAVDAEAHPDDVLGRLDVHVGGPVALGLGQDPGDDLHHWCVIGNHLGGVGGVGGGALLPRALHSLEGLHQSVHTADGPVAAVDGPLDVRLRSKDESDRVVVRLGEERADADRRLIGDGHLEAVIVERDGYRHVLAHDVLWDQRECIWFRIVPPEVDDGHVQEIRQKEGQLPRIERTHRHQGLADPLT